MGRTDSDNAEAHNDELAFDRSPEPIQRVARVYVAGSSAEIHRAERAIATLASRGIIVVSTWPDNVRDQGGIANPTQAPRDLRQRWSMACLAQIRDADLLWMLVPDRAAPTIGAWSEVGYALSFGKELVFSGDTLQTIFSSLGYEFADDDLAVEFITRIVDAQLRDSLLQSDAIDNIRRDAEQWRITARELARRLRNLRGIDDPFCAKVLEHNEPIAELPEVRRG